MKTHLECFPCFLRQTVIAVRLCTQDETFQIAVIKGVAEEIKTADATKPPAYTTTFLHRKIRQLLHKDPYEEIKTRYNKIALSLYPELKKTTLNSQNPLVTAMKLAIAGNVIDFGIYTSIDIKGTIEKALNQPLKVDDFLPFKQILDEKKEILYLLDNAGEIVFDRLLIEEFLRLGIKVKAVVKGEPVLNDSTIKDADEVGLTEICEVIDNGSDCIGTIIEMTSEGFKREFENASLIVSKGQGNFETLDYQTAASSNTKKICHLFQSKCEVVSRELGLPIGSMLIKLS
jgi:uncharacterized protein with ATP-grasp and redox domains